ncbi:MAG: 6,7-dimethyl-8-ribityllumazine synthase [Pseudomonadota bacterium]
MNGPTIETLEGALSGTGVRVGVLATRWNDFIVERLTRGAVGALTQAGVASGDIKLLMVPGAYELPIAASKAARSGRFHMLVALGTVIRGATPHFDYVAGECASGLSRVALDTGVPVGFGVLTVDTLDQAIERAGAKAGNKGAEASLAALETLGLLRQLDA